MPELTLADPATGRQHEYWQRTLTGLPTTLSLPADVAGDRGQPTQAGRRAAGAAAPAHREVRFPVASPAALAALARTERVSPLMVLASALGLLVSRYSRQDDVVINTFLDYSALPVSGPGPQAGRVVIPISCGGQLTFADLLRSVRDRMLDAYAFGGVPDVLLGELAEVGLAPSAQVAITHADGPDPLSELHFAVAADGSRAKLHYRPDLFTAQTAELIASQFSALLSAAVASPMAPVGTLSALSGADTLLLDRWNQTAAEYDQDSCLHELVTAAAAQDPAAVAVVTPQGELTYAQLEVRANQLAHHLRAQGVSRGSVVAVSLGRSADIAVAFLAVLKAGGVYLPVDPSYPAARIEHILRAAQAGTLITTASVDLPVDGPERLELDTEARLIAARPGTAPDSTVGPDDLAYLIYTSGSTGRPKGVEVAHRGAVNLARVQRAAFGVGPADRVALFSSISFDASIWELVMALANGASLAVLSTAEHTPAEIAGQARELGVSVGTFPPTFLRAVQPAELPAVRLIVAAGEACSADIVDAWAPGRQFVNAYGPTETTVCATLGFCRAPAPPLVPIGGPLANIQVYVMTDDFSLAPIGTAGHLYVGGVGLARGYRGAPAMTAAAYLPNPYGPPGSRMYRTGDMTAWAADGSLTCLGRVDDQVKLRGFRIELGEIEASLIRHDEVRDAAVILRGEQLVAYVTRAGTAPAGPGELRSRLHQHLSTTLPAYMLPGAYVELDGMPTTPSGKVDRARLPVPSAAGTDGERQPAEPSGPGRSMPVADLVRQTWSARLGTSDTGPEANFFELGGHSLVAAQIIGDLREALAAPQLPMRILFENPDLGVLIDAVAAAVATAS